MRIFSFVVTAVVALSVLAPAAPVRADALSDGSAAYARGDYATAAATWGALAARGNAEAEFRMGVLHLRGEGVKQNTKTAMDWFRTAAGRGHPEAQYLIGSRLVRSPDEKDHEAAYRMFRDAADQGHAGAMVFLAQMFNRGHGVPRDGEQSEVWMRTAALSGSDHAALLLSQAWQHGKGVDPDPFTALIWMEVHVLLLQKKSGGRSQAAVMAKVRDRLIAKYAGSALNRTQIAEALQTAREWTVGIEPWERRGL